MGSLCRNGCQFRPKGPRLALATKGEKFTSLTLQIFIFRFYYLTSAVAQNKRTMGRVAPHGSQLHAKALAHAEQQGLARPTSFAGSCGDSETLRTHDTHEHSAHVQSSGPALTALSTTARECTNASALLSHDSRALQRGGSHVKAACQATCSYRATSSTARPRHMHTSLQHAPGPSGSSG